MSFLQRIVLDRSGSLSLVCRRLCVSQLRAATASLAGGGGCSPVYTAPEEVVAATSRFRDGIQYIASRFFAVPVQGKPNEDIKSTQGPRLNEAIKAKFIRLVTDDGHTIVSREEALDRARKLDLDLVEVQRTSTPPVCKIMDFHKEKFKKENTEKERAKTKSESTIRKGDFKEVRLKGKIAQKDVEVKAEAVKGLLERGYRVKCMAIPSKQRGSEECDLGGLLNRLTDLIEDVISVESGPFVEKQQAYVVVRHVKFASKKGKKAAKAASAPATTLGDAAAEFERGGGGALESDSEPEDVVRSPGDSLPSVSAQKKVVGDSSPPAGKPGNGFAVEASRLGPTMERDHRHGRGIEADPRLKQPRQIGRGGGPMNIPRRQENPDSRQPNAEGGPMPRGDGASPASSYGVFSIPTRPASGDRRTVDMQRAGERKPPADRRR